MKQKIFMMISAAVSAVLLLSPAWGQSAANDGGEEKASEDFRPEMPRLFYTSEQRRVLEAVRQDVISEENFEEDTFTPLILKQEQIDLTPTQKVRNDPVVFDSFIRNRKTGKGLWWGKGEEHQFSSSADDDLSRQQGILRFAPSKDGDGSIVGIDKFNKTRFILKVGQQLLPDGEISETYPVVLKKNSNN